MASARPDMARAGSSRPAVRIRRLQPLANGRLARGGLVPVPEDTALSALPPAPRSGLRAKLGFKSQQRDPEKDAKLAAIGDALQPGEAAAVVRDARGQATLAAAPAALVPGHHPSTSIPLPADPPARNEAVMVTETPPAPSRGWWPFGKKHDKDAGTADSAPPRVRDYGAADGPIHNGQYAEDIVDWLDVIDPEVSTVSTLSNLQNSLFLPDLGNLYNRMPTIDLSRRRRNKARPDEYKMREVPHVSAFAEADEVAAQTAAEAAAAQDASSTTGPTDPHRDAAWPVAASPDNSPEIPTKAPPQPWVTRHASASSSSVASTVEEGGAEDASEGCEDEVRRRERLMRSTSTVRGEYAVLPAGLAWDDWSEEEKAELDDHVRHLMHSRRERVRRRLRGFRKFVSRPLGFLITLYAVLITFWGAAWVLFLIGWIYVGDRKGYFVEIADQILTALFCVVGIGLAPFRVVDTYHMIYIAHYHHLTWRLRRERNLPSLNDRNDLPAPAALDPDLEAQYQKPEAPVLSPEQQAKLTHHQTKYHNSHTFYRPHETPTHRAFPLSLLIAVTVLLDCHSCLQMSLGGTTWGIYYKRRPSALTATILSCSISCNLTAGALISWGARRTRKSEEVEKRVRQALTAEAMRRLELQRRDEARAARGEPVGAGPLARVLPGRQSEGGSDRRLLRNHSSDLEVPRSAMEPALP